MKNKICIISLVTMIIIAISTTSFGFGLNMSFNKIDKINVGDEIILTINFNQKIIGATFKISYDTNLEMLDSQTSNLALSNSNGKLACVYVDMAKRGTNTLKFKFKVKSITNNIMSFNMEDAKFVTKLNEKTYTQNKEIKASITINKGDNSKNDNTTKDDTNKDNNSNDDTKQDNSSEDNNTSNDDVNKDDNSNNSNDNKKPDKDISDDNNGDTDDIPDIDIDDDTDDDLQDDTNKDNTTNDNKKNNNSNSEMIDNNNDNNTSNNNGENKDNNLNDNNNVKNNNTNQNNVKNNNSNTTNTNNIKGNDLTNSKSNTKDNNSNNKTVSIKNMPFTGTYAILYIAIVLAVIVTIVAGLRIKTKAKDFEDKYDK